MLLSPCGFTPDALQIKSAFPQRGDQKMLARDFFFPSRVWMLLAGFTARFIPSPAACTGTIAAFKIY